MGETAPECAEIREIRRRLNGNDLCVDPSCARCWKGDIIAYKQHIEEVKDTDEMAYATAYIAGIM